MLASLIACVAAGAARVEAGGDKPKDNGIGGTGNISVLPDRDNGIGGTGVVGTIRAFGSVFVNGLKMSYAPTAEVVMDGKVVDASRMRIGHVVSLVAERDGNGFSTARIRILHEVVGSIEAISGRRLRVLGQWIELGRGASASGLAVGQYVAVSGLRLPDQTIVASLVEPGQAGAAQIVGTVTRDAEGRLTIGSQRLLGVAQSMVGERVAMRGAVGEGGFDASFVSAEEWLPRGVRQALVETYLEQDGTSVTTADGLKLAPARNMAFHGVVRGVISVAAGKNGDWSIESFRASETLGNRGSSSGLRKPTEGTSEPTLPTPSGADHGAGAAPGVGGPQGFGGSFRPGEIPGMPAGPAGGPGGFPGPGFPGPSGGGPPRR
jgi:hypothetical protein